MRCTKKEKWDMVQLSTHPFLELFSSSNLIYVNKKMKWCFLKACRKGYSFNVELCCFSIKNAESF